MSASVASASSIGSGAASPPSSSGSRSSTTCHGTAKVGVGSDEWRIRPCGLASTRMRSSSVIDNRVFNGTAATPNQAHA